VYSSPSGARLERPVSAKSNRQMPSILLPVCLAALLTAQAPAGEPATAPRRTAESSAQNEARGQEPTPTAPGGPLEIDEQVVVTASRMEQKVRDVPASVTIVTAEDVGRSSARSVDELVSGVVGFSSLRESGSRGTHPTVRASSL